MKAAVFVLAMPALVASPALAERVALVIGNYSYAPAKLAGEKPNLLNPGNDAELISKSLRRTGFRVTALKNLNKKGIEDAVRDFHRGIKEGDMALFYYAGHGAQSQGVNYLVPVGVPLDIAEYEAAEKCYPAQLVLGAMEYKKAGLKLMVLDCCRDNPFSRSWRSLQEQGGQGMAQMKAPRETLIAYATAPGEVATDGRGLNSPYSAALAEEMLVPGVKVEDMFKNVTRRVKSATRDTQRPWSAGDLDGYYYFVPGAPPPPPPPPDNVPPVPQGNTPLSASLQYPFRNSLGMTFVPSGTPGLLMSVWETRVSDYRAFAGSGNPSTDAAYTLGKKADGGWDWLPEASWQKPGFEQTSEDPVVCVSLAAAEAFADWLTRKEKEQNLLTTGAKYRLPTALEWNQAAGQAEYPWGSNWPPPPRSGNFAGTESRWGAVTGAANWPVISGYDDGYARTAPCGRFTANAFGLHDMAGNAREWVQSGWAEQAMRFSHAKGGCWSKADKASFVSARDFPSAAVVNGKNIGYADIGFRLVLEFSP